MAKPQRILLFVAEDVARATATATAFSAASDRLGLPWGVRTSGVPVEPASLEGVAAVVAVDLATPALPNWTGRVESLTSAPDFDQAVSGLLARLLGGSDAPLPP